LACIVSTVIHRVFSSNAGSVPRHPDVSGKAHKSSAFDEQADMGNRGATKKAAASAAFEGTYQMQSIAAQRHSTLVIS
jgi:hypothetical protein